MSVLNFGFKYPLLNLKETNTKHTNVFTNYFKEYVESGYYILGPEVEKFENKMSNYIGQNHFIGVGNGTNALEITFQALGLKSDDEVLIQGNTYIVTAFALKKQNPKIIPVDITEKGIVDLEDIKKKITNKTKLIVVVHLYGDCCNMDELSKICRDNNLFLVEDCAQAQGSKYNGKMIGSFGDVSCFSFYPSKNLGAIGDGGAIGTSNEELYLKMKKIRNIGSTVKYVHDELGTNSRLNPCQAKILGFKLDYLNEEVLKKQELVKLYKKYLQRDNFEFVNHEDEKVHHSYHLCVLKLKNGKRDDLIKYAKDNGIEMLIHYPNLFYQSSIFEDLNGLKLEKTEDFVSKIFSIPLYSSLNEDNIKEICNILNKFNP